MPALAKSASKDAVKCPARSRTRNRKSAALSPRSIKRLWICCVVHGPVRVRGHAEDMHIPGTDLDHEEAVKALQGHRAVHVEEVGRKHRRGLRAQEIPPRRVGAPLGAGGIFSALRTRRIVDALTRWPTLSNSPWILLYPQSLFSVASRSMSAAISALTGGRPVRFG